VDVRTPEYIYPHFGARPSTRSACLSWCWQGGIIICAICLSIQSNFDMWWRVDGFRGSALVRRAHGWNVRAQVGFDDIRRTQKLIPWIIIAQHLQIECWHARGNVSSCSNDAYGLSPPFQLGKCMINDTSILQGTDVWMKNDEVSVVVVFGFVLVQPLAIRGCRREW